MSEQIGSAIRWASEQFEICSESPRLDAELLLAHCLGKPRSYLYSWPERDLSEACRSDFEQLVRRRLEPTPVAYLLGKREFFSLEFSIRPGTLVPRPETELLVEQALAHAPEQASLKICDLGTGTGIIAISLKKERPLAEVHATDIDPDCLALARENALTHAADIRLHESDWYRALPDGLVFDLIVANPPYIAAGHPFLERGDLPAEPQLALTPGATGLESLEIIIGEAPSHLAAGGYLILEHGYDQQAAVAGLLEDSGFTDIVCKFDHNDLPRTSIAKRVENRDSPA